MTATENPIPSAARGLVCAWAFAAACAPAQPIVSPMPVPEPTPPAQPAPTPSATPSIDESFRLGPPAPGPARTFVPPNVVHAELKNHVPVVLVHQPSGFVSVRLVAAGGLADVAPDRVAAATQMAWSLNSGTSRHTRGAIEDTCVKMGATPLEVLTYPDALSVGLLAAAPHLSGAIDLVAEVALQPSFELKAVEYARAEHARTREREDQDSSTVAAHVLRQLLFGSGTYGRVDGTAAEILKTRREEVVALHRRVFDPSRLTALVVGDFVEKDAVAALDSAIGSLAAHPVPTPVRTGASTTPSAARLVVVDKPGSTIAEIAAGFVGPGESSPDVHATWLALDVLADGAFGRLTLALSEERSLAPWIAHNDFVFRYGGLMTWRTRVATDSVAPTLAEAHRVLRAYFAEGPTEDELTSVRNRTSFALTLAFESTAETSSSYAGAVVTAQPAEAASARPERIAQVTVMDARTAAARYLDPDRMRTVVVGDWASLREPLTALGWGPIELRDVNGKVLHAAGSAHASR